MDKPHEYEYIEWVNFKKLSIDPTTLLGIGNEKTE